MSELLSSVVRVRQSGVRSVNVEHDLLDPSIAQGYVLTAQALSSLTRILNGLNGNSSSRAWTLTGPYGSGKSFFSLFIMNIICANQSAHSFAEKQLRMVDVQLAEQVSIVANLLESKGLLPIPITGYRASLQECLKQGLNQALQPFSSSTAVQLILADLDQLTEKSSRNFTHIFQNVIDAVSHPTIGYNGILVIFDELGKSLEYAAGHSIDTDIYLLQEIAEFTNRSGKRPFIFIGILHQAFERYATFLDSALQREWAKVQGRFEDIAFQEPPNQQMRLLVNALEISSESNIDLDTILTKTAMDLNENDWCPPLMKEDEFIDLCIKSYPLHPSVLVALPYIFRRLAQNERSLFAYLASQEPLGFQHFLANHSLPDYLHLTDVFDYLMANYQARLFTSGRAHILTEAFERLNNVPDIDPLKSDVLKTIGLLNWLGEVSHLQVTESTLLAALRSEKHNDATLRKALLSLREQKMVVFRRFNQTYAIWQGSDVDIEERLEIASRKVSSAFSLAEAVQRYMPQRPLVARRHSYQTGTLRYFEAQYVDSSIYNQISFNPTPGASGMILLCLPVNIADFDLFTQWAQRPPLSDRKDIVIGLALRTTRLAELLHELRCLHWVNDQTPELVGDQVARRELRARLASVEALIKNELEHAVNLYHLNESSNGQWFHLGKPVQAKPRQGLTHLLSDICDVLYSETPRIWNELINRRALSSQGAAARRNLIEGMLLRSDRENLGIEGYPPERSMYESLLKASGLHLQDSPDHWALSDPPDNNHLHLHEVWNAIRNFIFQPPVEVRSVTDLFQILRQPPYGLTDGVLPVFLCAFLLIHQNEVTFYREGTLRPELEIADWEILLRRPELFSVAGCRVEGKRLVILERFGRGLGVPAAAIPVVRTLIRNLKSLPEHTWRTQRLTAEVLAVRQTIETAHSPERLLFHDLPSVLGLKYFDVSEIDDAEVEIFFKHLNNALQTLANVIPNLRDESRDKFLAACGLASGDEGWQIFLSTANELLPRVTNPIILPLLRRAATDESEDARTALDGVLSLIAGRPLHNWTDQDSDRFNDQANYLGELIRLERNGSFPTMDLPLEQRQRAQEIATKLLSYLEGLEGDQTIIEEALHLLTHEILTRKDPDIGKIGNINSL